MEREEQLRDKTNKELIGILHDKRDEGMEFTMPKPANKDNLVTKIMELEGGPTGELDSEQEDIKQEVEEAFDEEPAIVEDTSLLDYKFQDTLAELKKLQTEYQQDSQISKAGVIRKAIRTLQSSGLWQ